MTDPTSQPSRSTRVETGCGKMYIHLVYKSNKLDWIAADLGKSGQCAKAQIEGLTGMITVALAHGANLPTIIDKLEGIRCPSTTITIGSQVLSCPDAIASVLKKELADQSKDTHDIC